VGKATKATKATNTADKSTRRGQNVGSAEACKKKAEWPKKYKDGSLRTKDGKFAGASGTTPGTPGVRKAEKNIDGRPGWTRAGKEISVRDGDGTLRRYDLVARNPKGKFVGIEVKSGTAVRTAQQRVVDANLNAAGGLDTVGARAAKAGIDRISSVELLKVP